LNLLFEPLDTVSVSAVSDSFFTAKQQFQTIRRTLGSGKTRVAKSAYKSHEFERRHFGSLVKFANELAHVCRIMFANLNKQTVPQWMNIDNVKNIVQSTKHFIVVCPPSCLTSSVVTINLESNETIIRQAFEALSDEGRVSGCINLNAVKGQRNKGAVIVYTALWHTMLSLKYFMNTQKIYGTVLRKLNNLNDNRCEKYARKSANGLSYVYSHLTPFWDCSSFNGVVRLLTKTSSSNVGDVKKAQAFCLALLRWAVAHTPVVDKRSPKLVAWIEAIQTEASKPSSVPAVTVAAPVPQSAPASKPCSQRSGYCGACSKLIHGGTGVQCALCNSICHCSHC